jgi:glycine cleavage system regulatory protein
MASYVLSVLGDDRSGLVEALSAVVSDHGGNWEKSHMTQLAGKFAGVVLITIPDSRAGDFVEALAPLEQRGLLDISVEAGEEPPARARAPLLMLEVVGNDHPGIVHELSHLLAAHEVSIDDLQTWTATAPMAGGRLFHANALVRLPERLSADDLVGELEALAADLMVDISVLPEDDGSG